MDWNKIKEGAKDLANKGLDASKDLAEKGMESAKEKRELKKQEAQELKDRIKQMDKEGAVYCPKCYSTSLTSNKKGVGVGKASVGTSLGSYSGFKLKSYRLQKDKSTRGGITWLRQ